MTAMPIPSNIARLLENVLSGIKDKSIRFDDLRKLLIHFGFRERIKHSHHIFIKTGIREIVNIQPRSDDKANKSDKSETFSSTKGYMETNNGNK